MSDTREEIHDVDEVRDAKKPKLCDTEEKTLNTTLVDMVDYFKNFMAEAPDEVSEDVNVSIDEISGTINGKRFRLLKRGEDVYKVSAARKLTDDLTDSDEISDALCRLGGVAD